MLVASTASAAALTTLLACSRTRPVAMGGFEQRLENSGMGTYRLALLVSGMGGSSVNDLPEMCRADGLSGIVYDLDALSEKPNRVEIVAEGDKEPLDALVKSVTDAAGASAAVREAWTQMPTGSYAEDFPVVKLAPKMKATIKLVAEESTLNYISKHSQIEAVFNRGLKLVKHKPSAGELTLETSGDALRLKSFVRWCHNGPYLAKADTVTVTWGE